MDNLLAFDRSGTSNWHRRSQPRQSFFRFLLPLAAPEPLRGNRIVANRSFEVSCLLLDHRHFPRHHPVMCFGEQLAQLDEWIGAGFRFADSCLNLSPVSHEPGLYQCSPSTASKIPNPSPNCESVVCTVCSRLALLDQVLTPLTRWRLSTYFVRVCYYRSGIHRGLDD